MMVIRFLLENLLMIAHRISISGAVVNSTEMEYNKNDYPRTGYQIGWWTRD